MLQSLHSFQIVLLNTYFEIPSLIRIEKITFENFGSQTTRNIIVRHKKRCSTGALCCTKCPNFSTTSQADLNCHIAEKHRRVRAKNTYKCNICLEQFSGFYALRKHRSSQHGIPIRTSNLDMDTLLEDIDDAELKEGLNFGNRFLVESELEKGRHSVFNFAMSSFNNWYLNEKLDHVFNQVKCAAKVNLAFGFVLKNIEAGMCRYFYVHENNTVMRGLNLCVLKMIWSTWKLQKMVFVIIAQEKERTLNGDFLNLQMLVFASLLEDKTMGCKDTVLPEPFLKNHNVNCLTFKKNTRQRYHDNLWLFRVLALHLHGNDKLEKETSKIFNHFLSDCEDGDPSNFQGVHMNDIPKVEDLLQINIFLYDIDFVDGELIGEFAARSIQKDNKSVKF